MIRNIIRIDEEKCTGCGLCIPNCPEGAIRIIGGKARLVGELFCDGLGACLGGCPEGAIAIEQREAVPYDERKVMDRIVSKGEDVIRAHLEHLRANNEITYLDQALDYLKERGKLAILSGGQPASDVIPRGPQCPGSRLVSFSDASESFCPGGPQPSRLTHWPIQLHLIAPHAAHYKNSDLLLAADCVAYSLGGFHDRFLTGRTIAIACPKLDGGQEVYLEKLKALVVGARIRSLTVVIMQVPCCRGLLSLAQRALEPPSPKPPVTLTIVGIRGDIVHEERM